MNLIFLGAPGAGKGTQGALLAARHDLKRISSGDLLRGAVRRGTALGLEAQQYMEAGELVPDEIILGLVREVIEDAERGFILDGFPRTGGQARALDRVLDDVQRPIDHVIVLRVPDDVLIKRISGRRGCPNCEAVYNVYFEAPERPGVCGECGGKLVQRQDDDPATVQRRLEVYAEQTRPLIDYYREQGVPVHFVDGHQPVEEVYETIEEIVAA